MAQHKNILDIVHQPKIIVHNLTFRGIDNVPGVLDFDQRGVIYANPYDAIVTKSPVDHDYLYYLQSLGWDFGGCTFVIPNNIINYQYNSIFHAREVRANLMHLHDYYVDTYNTTNEENEFSLRIEKPIYANCTLALKYGTKTGFRQLAKKLGLAIVEGVENIHSLVELNDVTDDLASKHISEELVIKVDEGISGAGSTKLKAEKYLKLNADDRKNFLQQAFSKVPQMSETSGAVVETWLDNVIASPSIQIQVFLDKSWRIVSMHDQILEKAEKWYVGCKYPQTSINRILLNKILADVETFIKHFISEGFIGFLGLDLIVTDKNDYFWIEANVRKPGTFYPRIIAEKLNSSTLNNIAYIATDFTIEKFKGIKFSLLERFFSDYKYNPQTKSGVVLYNVGALKDAGRFDIVCIGPESKIAEQVYLKIKNLLGPIS